MQLSRIFAPSFANSPHSLSLWHFRTFPNKRPPRVRARALHGTSCSASANSGSIGSFTSRHLIAVNVQSGVGIGPLQANVVLQRLPRNVRKRRPKRLPDSSVALRADFHLPLPRQRRRVPNLGGHDLGGHDFSRAVIARAATRHSAAEGSSPRYHTPSPFPHALALPHGTSRTKSPVRTRFFGRHSPPLLNAPEQNMSRGIPGIAERWAARSPHFHR